jgi:tetratricopeptide (TPR) repeat protein
MTLSMKIAGGCLMVSMVGLMACATDDKTASVPVPSAIVKESQAALEAKLARMRELDKGDKQSELIQQFKDEDFSAWRPALGTDKVHADDTIAVAYDIRGRAYAGMKNAEAAEKDLTLAVEISPPNGYFWNDLANVCMTLGDKQRAVDAYIKAVEMDRVDMGQKIYGWMSLGATLNAAEIFLSQTKYTEALKVMELWNDEDIQKMGTAWGARMLRMYGQIYAGMGQEEECLAKFKAALELERKR